MIIIEIIFIVALLSLGIIASITDLKNGRVYNKILLIYALLGFVLDTFYYGYFARDLFVLYIFNIGILGVISLILFYTHSFAGGDCKLTVVMAILYPANCYLIYGTTDITLYFTLCLAILYGYLYLLGFSLYSLVKGRVSLSKKYVKGYLKTFLKSFVSASGYICLINLLFIIIGLQGVYINEWIIRIICMLSAWIIGKKNRLKKWQIVVGIYCIDIVIGLILGFMPFSFNPENYILVILLLLCQMTIRTSLYQEVKVCDMKKGMILSSISSILMQNSRVRGLPPVSTEDLKSRLTEEQINSINRWAGSRKILTVTVVRKIPFAIFIFAGFLSYFIIWSVVR